MRIEIGENRFTNTDRGKFWVKERMNQQLQNEVLYNKVLYDEILFAIKQILQHDSQQAIPAVQSLSLNFFQYFQRWVRQISSTPEPFTIALSGASGCGKSTIREVLVNELSNVSPVSSFTQDNYYRNFEADFPEMPLETFYDEINFDDPAHLRFDLLKSDLRRLKSATYGDCLEMPKLRFGTPTAKPAIITGGLKIKVAPFIVTEGIHAFYEPAILPLYDFKIYVDISESHRRERWLARNRQENRGTTDNMWNTTVDCLERFILPTRSAADLVINNNAPQEQINQLISEIITILTSTAERVRTAAA